MRKFTAGLLTVGVLILGVASIASAQYPPGQVSLVLSPSTIVPGADFTATFTGCTTGQVVTFTLASDSASDTCASPAVVTMTAPTAPGTYTVTATSPDTTVTATLTVAPAGGSSAGALPTTGSDSAPIVQIAIGVLLAGLALAGVAWYRRRSAAVA